MPKGTAEDRIRNIEALGAKVTVTDGNYDDCARMITEDSGKYGWVMVPDTASEGDPQIARWVMQGYLTMASEIIEQIDAPPTHVFLQAGVGSMASTMLTALKLEYADTLPKFYIMEPHQADCFFRSGKKGESVSVEGDLNSIMAGLSCGVPSPDAWSLIKDYADGFFSIDDILSANGMRILANPIGSDVKVISGESGAVGTGLIDYIVKQDPQTKTALGLDENSRILVISTEGDTDRKNYRDVVWYGKYSQY
jgi:diaminopropionate ammonia-lyase